MLILTVRRAGYECETQSFRAYFGLLFAQIPWHVDGDIRTISLEEQQLR